MNDLLKTFLFVLGLSSLPACSQFSWPKVVERCAPAPQLVLSEVLAALQTYERPDGALKELALRHGSEVVLCTVQELLRQMAQARSSSPAERRGREFLARAGTQLPGTE